MLFLKHWNCKSRRSARAILLFSTVWCWVTQNTRVCSEFTVIRFQRKCSMAVIDWTSSWFGRRASIMELFVVSPDTVWYARVLLLFSASAMTDTGSKSFDCALVSRMEAYNYPENSNYMHYIYYMNSCHYLHYLIHYANYTHCFNLQDGWNWLACGLRT